jgi:stromal membrane-associated protein
MDGPPPSDPSVLEGGLAEETPEPAPQPLPAPSTSRPTHTATPSTSSARTAVTNRQPQPHQLLSATVAARSQAQAQAATPSAAAPPPPQQQQQQQPASTAPVAANNDLFTLDFHNPTPPATTPAPKKDVKQDILSLFSTSTPAAAPAPAASAFSQFGQLPTAPPGQQNVWGSFSSAPVVSPTQHQSNAFASTGAGMWGAPQQNLWSAPAPVQPAQQQQNLFNTNDVWAASSSATGSAGGGDLFSSTQPAKKDDVFGDIWGGFK